eukprot:COSAG01_NODE_2341_length_7870_cov_22.046712_1_plen_44_part_10
MERVAASGPRCIDMHTHAQQQHGAARNQRTCRWSWYACTRLSES